MMLAAVTTLTARPVSAAEIDLSTVVTTRVALETDDGTDQLSELIVEPELSVEFSNGMRLTSIVRLRADASDKLEPGQPNQDTRWPASRRWFAGDDVDVEWRELYLDAYLGDWFFRLGRQQVVWGQADGLKVLDVVNPQSFREFILPDFEDSRIPLWTANAEVPIGPGLLQLLWVPDKTYHDIPEPDAAFAFTSPRVVPRVPPGVPVRIEDAERPDGFISGSDAGTRYTAFVGGWEFSLNYFYHYADFAVLRQHATPTGPTGPTSVVVTPEYERTHTVGGTFNNAFGDFVVRGEAGLQTDRYFLTDNPVSPDGVFETPLLSYVVGLDYQGISDVFLSGQILQSYLVDDDPGAARDRTETQVTFLYQHDFLNETVGFEALLIHGINDNDGVVQLRLDYDWRTNVKLFTGVDAFYGDDDGLFGQFEDRNRMVLGVEVGF